MRSTGVMIFLTGTVLFVCSCGLFSPRLSEYPEPDQEIRDYFNFNTMLLLGGERFSKQNFEDFFDESFLYEVGLNSYSKTDLMNRLNLVLKNYDTLWVVWTEDPDRNEVLDQTKTNVLYRTYTVHVVTFPDSSLPEKTEVQYGGSSYFDITYDNLRGWQISRWVDLPLSDQVHSFFDPTFDINTP